jgi:hypothetical protein
MRLRHSEGKVSVCLVLKKTKALIEMQDPVSVKDVQKLTGRVAALNRFIPRAAERSLPFFQVLWSTKNFQWSESQKQAFQELKDYLSNMTKLCPLEDHVWFEDRWMVASLCDEWLTTLCGLILG